MATDKFVFRDYVDTRLVGVKQFEDKTAQERKQLLFSIQMQDSRRRW